MTLREPTIPALSRLAASLLTALAVASVAHVATFLAFFISNDFAPDALVRVNLFFLPSTIVAFVVLALFAALKAFAHWYFALPASLIAGTIGALLGTTISLIQAGTEITSQWISAIVGTLSGTNLLFIAAVTVSAVTLGVAVWKARLTLNQGERNKVVLVRLPATTLNEGEVTFVTRSVIDTDLADEQWDAYVDALSENGWTVVEVDPAADLADSVFVEDAVVIFGETAIITSPGAESRRAETAGVELAVRALGLRVERISLPGTLDGGDVLKVGRTVYVGRGGRTNAEGIRQLRALVSPLGFSVVAVPTTKVLHLKSAVTALPDGTIIGYLPNIDDVTVFDRFLAVPEESGSHVIELSADTVLMAASAPRSAELIAELGYRVVTVDISEFEKLEGCVTCLSVRVR